jgi:hypothetical protein
VNLSGQNDAPAKLPADVLFKYLKGNIKILGNHSLGESMSSKQNYLINNLRKLKLELFLLLPIFYSFKVAINDRDFAQMAVTVLLVAVAWLCTIVRFVSRKQIACED